MATVHQKCKNNIEEKTQQDVNSSYGGEKDAVLTSSHSTTLNKPRQQNSLNNI